MPNPRRQYSILCKPLRVSVSAVVAALLAGACAGLPPGNSPTVAMLPGGGKSMPAFNVDDVSCRDTAKAQAARNTPVPVAMGLGNSGQVVAAGAVTAQQRYDTAYVQCMSARGHAITVSEATST